MVRKGERVFEVGSLLVLKAFICGNGGDRWNGGDGRGSPPLSGAFPTHHHRPVKISFLAMELDRILEEVKTLKHYASNERILLVGEGDFSFALSLAEFFGTARFIVATTNNTEEELKQLYSNAIANIEAIRSYGGAVFTSFNATNMHDDMRLEEGGFDKIVFNFPEVFPLGRRTSIDIFSEHRRMIKAFFKSAKVLIKDGGEIHLTYQNKPHHKKWGMINSGKKAFLKKFTKEKFCKEDYPGYTNRKGVGMLDATFDWKSSYTWKFMKLEPRVRRRRRRAERA